MGAVLGHAAREGLGGSGLTMNLHPIHTVGILLFDDVEVVNLKLGG